MALFRVKKSLKNKLKKAAAFVARTVAVLALMLLAAAIVVSAPKLINDFLHSKVKASTVKISLLMNPDSGGTGFVIKHKDKKMIVTNAHVCRALGPSGLGAVELPGKTEKRLARVIRISDSADLCLMSGFEDIAALELGSEPEVGDTLITAGHPYLAPSTPNEGRLVAKNFIMIGDSAADCEVKRGSSVAAPPLFGMYCPRAYNSYLTTLNVHPGQSGSPVINVYGKVVAVVFATNTLTNQGSLVTWNDLRDFLAE